jgi:hypothetical protein
MLVLLSFLSLAFCLTVGGFLAADCVSSEKREGTLGLLFLTPLRGTDIVLGKLVCHGMQMLYGLCATFPVFFLPLLTGGVTWGEVSRIVLALALALILAASIGVLVSVFATESRQAILGTLSCIALLSALPMIFWMVRRVFLASPSPTGLPQLSPIFTVFSAFESNYTTARGQFLYWGSLIALFVLSLIAVLAAGLLLEKVFLTMSSGRTDLQKRAVQAVDASVMDRNPYEWLMLRNVAEGRSVGILTRMSVVFFATMLFASLITSHWQQGFMAAFFTAFAIHLLAKLHYAVEATRRINADRIEQTLELLLVTPLHQDSILRGHQRALFGLGRKPLLLLVTLNLVLEFSVLAFADHLHMDYEATVAFTSLFIGGIVLAVADFSALRWLGFIHGVTAPSHVKAALRTFSAAMVLPWVGIGLVVAIVASTEPRAIGFAIILASWVACCLLYDCFLVRFAGLHLHGGLRRLVSEGF